MSPLKIDLFPTLCIGLAVRPISQRGIMTLHLILLREFDYHWSVLHSCRRIIIIICDS